MRTGERLRKIWRARRELWTDVKARVLLVCFQKEWRALNPHNGTIAGNIFPVEKVSVGKGTYGVIKVLAFDNDAEQLVIGNYCSIAESTFLLGGEHSMEHASTFPIWTHILGRPKLGVTESRGPIVIEDDVWIGIDALFLSGVRVGKGAVISARSVVTKDVPPYAIWIGNHVARYRFDEAVREKMVKWDLTLIEGMTEEQQKRICTEKIDEDTVNEFDGWFCELQQTKQ